ncbi:mannose-6-phosphate isomerase [Terfezia boudieri ATCC MYA-4762]|uniref:Mannose-6-phosphate isomerase n=1 Tax=Terfezia boudieri ATCC MYA-4762 TaxID=1051890 RepID=A0A3N4LA57_9PEZI|nr:mannose-6-phosphate isomerase [Terfezia boudieri ATCC MYA-4762]
MVLEVPLYRLQCGANSYDWGKVGSDSAAARFAAATNFQIEEDKPYAELWMGTHPSNPSKDVSTNRPLLNILQTNQSLLSLSVTEKYGPNLPFLFKVLSIRKALSIQAHPDKTLAERLHAQDPKNYPDANHKPEMAIAVSEFDGFCGFRPLEETVSFLKTVPPLRRLVGEDESDAFISAVSGKETSTNESDIQSNKSALRSLYGKLMSASNDTITTCSQELLDLATSHPGSLPATNSGQVSSKTLSELILRLNSQFPNDIGLFNTFLLNYVRLQPGEAMFLRANEPHAYLSGDIMECMASSDNVVRAGFTPKFKDVKNLIGMLTYNYASPKEQKMIPTPFRGTKHSILYDPPIDEFSVLKTELRGEEWEVVPGIEGPSISIVERGRGWIEVGPKREELREGWVYFVGATAEVKLVAEGGDGLVVYRAFCEVEK